MDAASTTYQFVRNVSIGPIGFNPLGFRHGRLVFTIHSNVHRRTKTIYDVRGIPSENVLMTMQATEPKPAAASDVKVLLGIDEMPRSWYNILPDLPSPFPPYLHPGTKEPVPPQAFEPLFPKELIRQEMSPNRFEP